MANFHDPPTLPCSFHSGHAALPAEHRALSSTQNRNFNAVGCGGEVPPTRPLPVGRGWFLGVPLLCS